jgi:hypothetical protein
MTSRIKRGISMRVRLGVAAAVVVGGGAAGVVAVAASNNGASTAQSAGYSTSLGSHRTLSETQALSSAMNGWNKSPSKSLSTLAQMKPMSTFSLTPFHTHMLALQRGTVVATAKNEFVIKSTNRTLELWHIAGGTKLLNVGASPTGMAAMTGGTMAAPHWMNTKVKNVAKGDLVFIFGEKVHGELIAQLVLFVAPVKPVVTPTATPTAAPTVTVTATPSMTVKPTVTATPSVTTTAPNTVISGTPAVSSTHS